MTEPSEAARRKARELFGGSHHIKIGEARRRVARVLQEHSDVAKEATKECNRGEWAEAAETLQSLILPDDEPENQTECYKQAVAIAVALHSRLNGGKPTGWKPLPDISGVLDQIDNMTTGFVPADAGYEIRRKGG